MKNFLIVITMLYSVLGFCQQTYKVGKTEYIYDESYSTTGKPMVKRSEANKLEFLRIKYNLSATPVGYQIDHIIPLSEGGTDDLDNMQLLTIEQHARKTAEERAGKKSYIRSTYTNSYSTTRDLEKLIDSNNVNSTNLPVYDASPTTTLPSTNANTTTKSIQTGPRGGQYYINSNGNKTYVKKN